ncbi:MAG TPA: hypothetical protein VF821_01535, partial [Lentzea sp.]
GEGVAVGGWCAFGSGTVHIDVMKELGIDYRRAQAVMVEQPIQSSLTEVEVARNDDNDQWLAPMLEAADALGIDFERSVWTHLGALRPGEPSHQIAESRTVLTTPPVRTRTDDSGLVVDQLLIDPGQIHLVRDARGMSNRETAAGRASDTGLFNGLGPISRKMIEKLETTGQLPGPVQALARLDTVYQADGWLGATRTFDSRAPENARKPVRSRRGARKPRPHVVGFPAYWVGPIWLQPWHDDPAAMCTITLEWEGWKREQVVRSRSLLTTRKASRDSKELRVTLPEDWNLVAGVGEIPEAGDVNIGWYPANQVMLITLAGRYLLLMGRTLHRVNDDDIDITVGPERPWARRPRRRKPKDATVR